MKTREQVEEIKRQWLCDPCWDIEETEGFREYKEELFAFRKQYEKDWKRQYEARVAMKARSIGCPDNFILAEYVMNLESRIEELSRQIEKIQGE